MLCVVGREDSKSLRIIKHPIRKRIIELLGTRENMSFTELKNEMNLPVGTLYYHLDVLRGYVLQDNERRYFLSKDGKKLYGLLASYVSSTRNVGRTIFVPSWFFPVLEKKVLASITCFILVSVSGGVISYLSGEALIILHYGITIFSRIFDALLFPLSIIFYMTYTAIIGHISNRHLSLGGMLISSIVYTPQLLPLLITLTLYDLQETFTILHLTLTVLVQVISTILGAAYISSIYGIRLERSLLSQTLFYITSTIVFSFLQTLHIVTTV